MKSPRNIGCMNELWHGIMIPNHRKLLKLRLPYFVPVDPVNTITFPSATLVKQLLPGLICSGVVSGDIPPSGRTPFRVVGRRHGVHSCEAMLSGNLPGLWHVCLA